MNVKTIIKQTATILIDKFCIVDPYCRNTDYMNYTIQDIIIEFIECNKKILIKSIMNDELSEEILKNDYIYHLTNHIHERILCPISVPWLYDIALNKFEDQRKECEHILCNSILSILNKQLNTVVNENIDFEDDFNETLEDCLYDENDLDVESDLEVESDLDVEDIYEEE
jgi:hypothetical protein